MKLSLGEKTFRVVRFLLGIRNPRIATALAGYGFKQQDRDEGWALINALGKGQLSVLPAEPPDMETLLQLDAWENQWFPIARAALERRFPQVSARFFLNLTQTEGPAVAISVRTFVDRYEALSTAVAGFGAEGPQARELLISRGLSPTVIAEAEALLTALTQVAPATVSPSFEEEQAELDAAEAALWSWYLEWSRIARVAIKQRALLKELGFLNTPRAKASAEEGDTPEPPTASPSQLAAAGR